MAEKLISLGKLRLANQLLDKFSLHSNTTKILTNALTCVRSYLNVNVHKIDKSNTTDYEIDVFQYVLDHCKYVRNEDIID